MMSVETAITRIPAHPGMLWFTALKSCAPTMTFTEDHPIQARILKTATTRKSALCPQSHMRMDALTDLYTVPSEIESTQYHLSQTKARAKGGEEADRSYSNKIDEEDDQDGIDKSKVEDGVCEGSNCKG